ncbi:germination protein [Siminovitchia terrae]|uniref:Germination protein n=1 Tax=Siminovitchia terrae TaxID=1914933 RepID=A0A429X594_SIMTE|nr:endospore germination permease [Siminovitchia terrae]RST58463.1 spore gernimation protein [Siminovitchia terrae]GIN96725.1 germination protein [Siminovitchia terrae]
MEKGKISALQMAILLYPAVIATAILSMPGFTAQSAGRDMWISPILASFAGFLAIYLAVSLHNMHRGKTIIQISEAVVGKIPGKVIGFLIIVFYLDTTGTIVRGYSEFIVTSFLFKTPQVVVISSMVFICALCIYGGLEVMARAGQLLFPIFVLPIIFSSFFLAPDLQPKNMLPILENGWLPVIKGAIPPIGWFSEFFIIAFLLPYLSNAKKGMKYGLIAVLGVMVSLVIVHLLVLFMLGDSTANKIYPLMNVGRYASVAGFFENMEAVIMAVWIAGAFVKTSVFYYICALGIAQWLNLSDYRPIVWPLGILLVQFSFWGVHSTMEIGRYDFLTFPYSSAFTQLCLPLLLLVIAIVLKKKKKKSAL